MHRKNSLKSSVLSVVSDIHWGSWNAAPADKGVGCCTVSYTSCIFSALPEPFLQLFYLSTVPFAVTHMWSMPLPTFPSVQAFITIWCFLVYLSVLPPWTSIQASTGQCPLLCLAISFLSSCHMAGAQWKYVEWISFSNWWEKWEASLGEEDVFWSGEEGRWGNGAIFYLSFFCKSWSKTVCRKGRGTLGSEKISEECLEESGRNGVVKGEEAVPQGIEKKVLRSLGIPTAMWVSRS